MDEVFSKRLSVYGDGRGHMTSTSLIDDTDTDFVTGPNNEYWENYLEGLHDTSILRRGRAIGS